jgi:hypothetical protein
MKAAIVQSNYIPWRGYFDLIDDADVFVFYDDVQYTDQDWRNRNRIKTQNGPMWLSVPVLHDITTLIQDARIDYKRPWVDKHVRSLSQAYGRAPFFHSHASELFEILQHRPETISSLNVGVCRWAMAKLGISTRVHMSSEFAASGDRQGRLIEIIRTLGADCYVSGPSARSYLDARRFEAAGIALEYKAYKYSPYPQLHGQFEPNLSVVDLIFNCGDASRTYLKSLAPSEGAI